MERIEPKLSVENLEIDEPESRIGDVYLPPEASLSYPSRGEQRSALKVMNIIIMLLGLAYLTASIFISQNFTQSKANLIIQLSVSLMLVGAGYIPFHSIKNGFLRKNKVLGLIANGLCVITLVFLGVLLISSASVNYLYLLILGALIMPFVINILYLKNI